MNDSLKNRFFSFSTEKNCYVYDKFSNSINRIDKDLFIEFENGNFDTDTYSSKEKEQKLAFFLNQKEPVFSFHPDEKCYVSINLSSSCNMNCSYCFKVNQSRIKKDTLEEIFNYVTEEYYPNAKEFVFSVGYSSEPFLDLELIDYLDELIAKKEGFLIHDEDFISVTPEEVLIKLLDLCGQDAKLIINQENCIESINTILENIDINLFLDDSFLKKISAFYYNFLEISRVLCKSKRVQINRRIVEQLFYGKIKIFDCKQYYTICFMTNGFNISPRIINYLKMRLLNNICISLDGSKEIHDLYRKDQKGSGTYDKIIKNITLLQKSGIEVYVSCVITPNSINLIEIFEHLLSIGIVKIDFHYMRNVKIEKCFTVESIELLNIEINRLYKKLKNDLLMNDYRLLKALIDSKLFFFLRLIVKRQFNLSRCKWGYEIIFDTKGNIYPCQYMLRFPEKKLSHYMDSRRLSEIQKPIYSNELDNCKTCWAEYICGGTCHYSSYVEEGDIYKTNRVECKYNKNLIINTLDFCIFLIENNLYKQVSEFL